MAALNNEQHEMFCQEYVLGFSKADAARKSGYGKNTDPDKLTEHLSMIGSRVYAYPQVRARINELLEERLQRYSVTSERLILEIAKIAFVNIKDVISNVQNGVVTFKNLEDIPNDITAAIKKIEQGPFGLKVEFYDKQTAMEQLAKFLGLYKEDNRQKINPAPQIYLPDNNRQNADTN